MPVLIVIRAAPCSGLRAREALDAALLFSAFEPQLSVLFSGEGVWQLVRDQLPEAVDAVPVASVLAAFGEYGIDTVCADAAALAARGLQADSLSVTPRLLDDQGLQALYAAHDRVLTF